MKFDDEYDFDGNLVAEGRVHYFDTNPKLNTLVSILKDKPADEKTIVWSVDVPAIKQISERLTREGIKHVTYYGEIDKKLRQGLVDQFNTDTDTKVFLGNPLAGGIGLNLLGYDPMEPEVYDTDATQVIHYSQNWRPDIWLQGNDRAHRMGTRRQVQITGLVIPRTIDEEIRNRVEDKNQSAADLSDIKSILKRVLTTKLETAA
jgi:SNF2 family DNA or RNA helicase